MSEAPSWLTALVQKVAEGLMPHCDIGPLGLRFREQDGEWDALVYPLPIEILGGASDGQVAAPGYSLDVERLRQAFDAIEESVWHPHGLGPDDDNGPCLAIKGRFQERSVCLRVLAYAPEDESPGLKYDTNRRPEND